MFAAIGSGHDNADSIFAAIPSDPDADEAQEISIRRRSTPPQAAVGSSAGHAVSADHEGGGAADKLLHWDAPSAGLSQPAVRFRPFAVGEHVGGRPLVLFERHYEVRFNPKQYLRTNLSGASNREGGDGILQGQR